MKDLDFNNGTISILKGVISGFLIAYLIVLGLRPSAEYPDNLLEIIDNPWIFVVLVLINFYVMQWDTTIGLLMLLSIIALILDIIIFTGGEIFSNDVETFKSENTDEADIDMDEADIDDVEAEVDDVEAKKVDEDKEETSKDIKVATSKDVKKAKKKPQPKEDSRYENKPSKMSNNSPYKKKLIKDIQEKFNSLVNILS